MTRPKTMREPIAPARGGEIAFVVLSAVLLLVTAAAAAGVGLSAALFGHGWVWPHGSRSWVHLIGALTHGHPAAAFDAHTATRLPTATVVYACVGVCEAGLVLAAGCCAVWVSHWWRGPTDPRRGMATRVETRDALGVTQLRANRHIIRPDLYRRRTR